MPLEIAQVRDNSGKAAQANDKGSSKTGSRPVATACQITELAPNAFKGGNNNVRSCATATTPARIKVTCATNQGIVVRAVAGNVEALLSRNGEILDISLNKKNRVQLILPPGMGEFELVVSTVSASETFDVSLVGLTSPNAGKKKLPSNQARPGSGRASDADLANGNDMQESEAPGWVSMALQYLGFDLAGPLVQDESPDKSADLRAIMAFQADQKFAISGRLEPEQITRLATLAAKQVDVAAQDALRIARQVSQQASIVQFDKPETPVDSPMGENDRPAKKRGTASTAPPSLPIAPPPPPPIGLKSMKGGFLNGKFFGAAVFRSEDKFEGEWLDGPTAGDSQRPSLGVIYGGNNCSIAVKTYLLPSGGRLINIISHSIGVLRQKEKVLLSGDLSGDQFARSVQPCLKSASGRSSRDPAQSPPKNR